MLEETVQKYLRMVLRGFVPTTSANKRAALDRLIMLVNRELRENGKAYDDNEITLAIWEGIHRERLLAGFIAAGTIANENRERVGPADVEETYTLQADKIDEFSSALKDGSWNNAEGRAGLYSPSVKTGYFGVGVVFVNKFLPDLWISKLNPAEHCSECIREAGRQARPISQIVPIGQRLCNIGCKCELENVTTGSEIVRYFERGGTIIL